MDDSTIAEWNRCFVVVFSGLSAWDFWFRTQLRPNAPVARRPPPSRSGSGSPIGRSPLRVGRNTKPNAILQARHTEGCQLGKRQPAISFLDPPALITSPPPAVSEPMAATLGLVRPWVKFKSTPPHHPNHFSIPIFSLLPPPTFPVTSLLLRPSPGSSRFLPSVSSEQQLQVSEDDDDAVDDDVDEEEEMDDPSAELSYLDPETDPDSITEWELDFCSRPILDIRGKKLWELVICDDSLSLQYTKYFPNNVINSITLRDAIVSACDSLSLPLPDRIRYFRSQMQTIITKACKELGIKPIASKRCLSLHLWLEERYETVYTRHPGFQKGSKPLLALDNPFPTELPDNLFGEKWAFVQLPFSAVREEIASLQTQYAFGAGLDLDLLGIEIDDQTLIPGLSVATSRAEPLAAWMNGLEICSVEADTSRACLVLSVGISTRYVYATYKKTPVTTSEAEAWESAKRSCGGLHFLAIQPDLESEDCVGFWLLLDLPPPPV